MTARLLELVGELPPMIIVGVDNPVSSVIPEQAVARALSLTPTRVISEEQTRSRQLGQEVRTGGAEESLTALEGSIIPWVETQYPVSAAERGLVGDSLGGLFASFVLLSSPQTFTHYLIGSPSLRWDDGVMFEREEAYARAHRDLPARVFMSAGADEDERASWCRIY